MTEFVIKYRDFEGRVTERRISDVLEESEKAYDAFCHLRGERRSFTKARILEAIEVVTGAMANPYRLVPNGAPVTLEEAIGEALPAIKALKFFTLTTRGFAKRERERVGAFVREVLNEEWPNEELEPWLQKLWCGDRLAYFKGDVSEYKTTLQYIPHHLLPRCREYAMLIARGSGRKAVNEEWMQRIDLEFVEDPVVAKPVRENEEQALAIGVRFTVE